MTATYTFDIVSGLDGFASYRDGDWGGYWGKQGPEFLDRRLALYGEDQRMVYGANTFRQFLQLLGPSPEQSEVSDPVNTRLMSLPTTVVSTTLEGPVNWPNATLVRGDALFFPIELIWHPLERISEADHGRQGSRRPDQSGRLQRLPRDGFGHGVTVLTQSSTITNSVLVPFAGAGILTPA